MSTEFDPGPEEPSLEASARLNEALDLLSSPRRRTLLRILAEAEEDCVDCSALATDVVEREGRGYTVERDLVLIDLHHRQLPKLVEAGVVEYDYRSGEVRYDGDDLIEELARGLAEVS